ncbi:MAG: hypothetical protein WD876_00625 [Candidatus Pacearchaeota archaeon]
MAWLDAFGAGWVFVGIVILVIIAVVAIVQKRQSMATGVVKIVAIFFVVSVGYVFIVNNVQINSLNSLIEGTEIYLNWLYTLFEKTADVTSYAVKQDWTANTTG